ncbi:hypothetical protein FOMPIDRAFT_1030904 [Fomitopsis schrenkii]|uniref:tRNA-dihydrouridine(16/17) synthase [NAD(P)(+)] n=1 Tax=Fomitopsis schrenkii TaxID=2126942 RepID=S8FCQ5_FOMSC|nr:hypothetical protein FOMPIDRAFT_1030904 [Fomitopsis schrenkii]
MPDVAAADRKKLACYDFYRDVLGSPKFVVAPMVDQSELLVYTPMINAKMFSDPRHKYREEVFNTIAGEEGGPEDRPLIIQFCANDSEQLLASAKALEPYCDAVDINLGCPQDIARRGHYGSYLQDEWDVIYKLINTLHRNLSVPVTAKFRVFSTVEKTVEYAQMLERAGAQMLTCHGRTRDQRGHNTGLADWEKIRAVKEAVSVPVIANGNVLFHGDVERLLAATGADAVMSAEGNLYNPALFSPATTPPLSAASSTSSAPSVPTASSSSSSTLPLSAYLTGAHPRHTNLALEYLEIVKTQQTHTPLRCVKGHLFKLLKPALSRETDLRDRLGRVRYEKPETAMWEKYEEIVKELDERMQRDTKAVEGHPLEALVTLDSHTGLPILPHWLAQPYFRPPPPTKAKGQQEQHKETTASSKRVKWGSEIPQVVEEVAAAAG